MWFSVMDIRLFGIQNQTHRFKMFRSGHLCSLLQTFSVKFFVYGKRRISDAWNFGLYEEITTRFF